MHLARALLHPVRLRIVTALSHGPQTTAALDDLLDDVPRSSIYRHVRVLQEAGMLTVAQVEQVGGAQEKSWALARSPRLGPEDLEGLSSADHAELFGLFWLTQLTDFTQHLEVSHDLHAQRSGYVTRDVHATDAEFDAAMRDVSDALARLQALEPAPGRRARRFVTVTFPTGDPDA